MTNGPDRPTLPPDLQELVSQAEGALQLFNAGHPREAIELAGATVQAARIRAGDRPPFVSSMLVNQANLYIQSGYPGPAEAMLQEALDLRRRSLGDTHDAVAHCLNQLAILYTVLRRFEDSERCYRECLDIVRAKGGEEQPAYADGLSNLGVLYREMRENEKAESYHGQAVEIFRQTLGPRHPDVAKQLQQLGTLAARRGAFDEAEQHYREALDILREAAGEGHPSVADALTKIEALYRHAGDTAAAERVFEEAMAIRREAFGPRHPAIAGHLFDLAALHATEADHASAEQLLLQALDIWREALGERHPNVARALRNLASVYWATGDYARAEPMEHQALDIEREALGDRHPAVAGVLSGLGATYRMVEAFPEAERMYLEALDIRRETLGDRHPEVAATLNNLGALYLNMGRNEEAERLCGEALNIARDVGGERSFEVATSLANLGAIARYQGDYERAERLAKESLDIVRPMGERHPNVLHRLNDLAYVCVATGRPQDALALFRQMADIHDGYLQQVFTTGSERRRQAFLSRIETSLHALLSLVRSHLADDANAVRSVFDLVLRRKGIGAEAVAAERDAILAGRHPEHTSRFKELALLRMEIAQASLAGPGPEGPAEHERRLEELATRKEALERALASALPEVDLARRLREADRAAVSEVLPPESALVEFVQFHDIDFLEVPSGESPVEPRRRYLAFVLPAGRPEEVRMVDLGEAGPIDERIAAYRASVTGEGSSRGTEDEQRAPAPSAGEGEGLRAAVFDPLAAHLGDATRVFLAPDGDLTRLPFEVLPTAEGRLIERYTFSYLSTGRDVLRFGAPTEAAAPPLVAAAPDFDLGGGPATDAGPGRRSRDLDPETIHFDALAGTEEEGTAIGSLLGTAPWLGAAVLEARLKAAPSPRILHLATHGFFLPDQTPSAADDLGQGGAGGGGPLRGAGMENPLLRSGLALAGANTFLRHGALPPEAEDGIITAEDVSGLDLLSTQLVVLSACETGLGEVRVGEGVFGLRRAFVLAGARTLVMSLWKVPDAQSSRLMQRFYENLRDGLPRAEALRSAQLELARMYPHPWFWGAFICQGDPGPLGGVGLA